MTRDEILAMVPGYELDVLIAQKVMGLEFPTELEMREEAEQQWKVQPHCRHFFAGYEAWIDQQGFQWRYKTKLYSTMISAAWEVVEKMKGAGLELCITFDECKWSVDFRKWNPGDGTDHHWIDGCESASEAICKSALLAVMDL